MLFDFLGTFNAAMFARFAAFAKSQLVLVSARIQHLQAEQSRVGSVTFAYDQGGIPTGYVAEPDSQIGKLMAVYEVLGGDALHDLNIRASTQPVFLLKGDETTEAQVFSNGEVKGSVGLADAASAELMHGAREWLLDTMSYRREYVARKIRRLVDYSDQLQQEIKLLESITNDPSARSLSSIFAEIQGLITDTSYRAITPATDPFGKAAYAPFTGYTPGPQGATADGYGRAIGGNVVPGDKEVGT